MPTVAPHNVFQFAVDRALVRHVESLFDHFCADLEIESRTAPGEILSSTSPTAFAKFKRSFAFARATHSQMSEHLRQLRESEQ